MEKELVLEELNVDELSPAVAWTDLPFDVTANILQRLGFVDRLDCAQLVCTEWWNVCQDPSIWRRITFPETDDYDYDEEEQCLDMFRRAVDMSQGQLIQLYFSFFGDNTLLDYIAHRSRHLRSLTVAFWIVDISGNAMVETVKKLPNLEELHILSSSTIRPQHIETIAVSCPSLNSFALDRSVCSFAVDGSLTESPNDYAVAIAKNMPNLQHLRLSSSDLDNVGLEAILDGCTRLQSLDLEQCYRVDLKGELGKRCRAQIKHLNVAVEMFDCLFQRIPDWED